MTVASTTDLRYLYRRQESTGIWIQEHGPFESERLAWAEADRLNASHKSRLEYVPGICTSEDGRTVITEYPR